MRKIPTTTTTFATGRKSLTVQDRGQTVQAIMQKMANGVISEDVLNRERKYTESPIPAHLDKLDRLDLARANAAHIKDLQDNLAAQNMENPTENPATPPPAGEENNRLDNPNG